MEKPNDLKDKSYHDKKLAAKTVPETITLFPRKTKYEDDQHWNLFADDKKHVTEKMKFVLERVESIVGKIENAGHQHFLRFSQCFEMPIYKSSKKLCDCVVNN